MSGVCTSSVRQFAALCWSMPWPIVDGGKTPRGCRSILELHEKSEASPSTRSDWVDCGSSWLISWCIDQVFLLATLGLCYFALGGSGEVDQLFPVGLVFHKGTDGVFYRVKNVRRVPHTSIPASGLGGLENSFEAFVGSAHPAFARWCHLVSVGSNLERKAPGYRIMDAARSEVLPNSSGITVPLLSLVNSLS